MRYGISSVFVLHNSQHHDPPPSFHHCHHHEVRHGISMPVCRAPTRDPSPHTKTSSTIPDSLMFTIIIVINDLNIKIIFYGGQGDVSSIIKVLTSSWSKGCLKGAPKLGVPNQNFFGKSEMGCFTKQNDCWLKVNLVLARTSLTLYYVRAKCFTLCTNGPWGLERQVYRKDTLGLFGQSPWSTKKK